ncbi:MAG: tetratricopeptide repeat protein [Bacteroidetes bacterium]|nr:tetratricopeptide repeat protein [Bacteroidota bacterium]
MPEITGYLERADQLLSQGRPKEAEAWVKKVLEAEPENDYALSVLARCFLNSKQYDKGIEVIKQALSVDPEVPHYYYLAAFGYYQKSERASAIFYLNKAIELNPYYAEYFGLLAFIYIDENGFKEALNNANEGLAIDAGNITCLNARSTALNKLRMTDDAVNTMQDALAQDPDNEFTHATVGWNYLEKGKHKEAANHFREALRIDPDYQNAKTGLKEALKSKIAPYRWLLQYSFWLRNKGKQFRWIFILGIFFGVRIIMALGKENSGFENLGLFVGGLYLLFAAASWIINPLANTFLLMDKEGKYALTNSEKWNAISFMICVFAGIAIIVLGNFIADKNWGENLLIAGLVVLSLCIPLGHMRFPVRFQHNTFSQWIELGLITSAIITLLIAFLHIPVTIMGIIYFIFFVVYTWAKAF